MDDFNEITSSRSKDYLRALPFHRRRDLREMCPKAKPNALDLMRRCLTFSPRKRITVEEALEHPYLEPYHDPSDEPGAEPLHPDFFDFENRGGTPSRETLKRESERAYELASTRVAWLRVLTDYRHAESARLRPQNLPPPFADPRPDLRGNTATTRRRIVYNMPS